MGDWNILHLKPYFKIWTKDPEDRLLITSTFGLASETQIFSADDSGMIVYKNLNIGVEVANIPMISISPHLIWQFLIFYTAVVVVVVIWQPITCKVRRQWPPSICLQLSGPRLYSLLLYKHAWFFSFFLHRQKYLLFFFSAQNVQYPSHNVLLPYKIENFSTKIIFSFNYKFLHMALAVVFCGIL